MYHLSTCVPKKFNLVEQASMTVLTKLLEKNLLHIHLGLIHKFKCIFYNLHSLKNLQKSYKTKPPVDTKNINTSSLSLLLDNAKNHYSENLHN